MLRLIQMFQRSSYEIHFMSAAATSDRSEDLSRLGCTLHQIVLNDSSFDQLIKALNPDVVVFDRFISEEHFGWRVAEICPETVRILDTEDLHFLRSSREKAIKRHGELKDLTFQTDIAKREISSIYRCDLTLMISEFEMNFLQSEFKISSALLYYLPFVTDGVSEEEQSNLPTFEERAGFMTIGNFKHPPNYDSVRYIKSSIWPEIKRLLPQVKMDVYGAYMSENLLQWNNSNDDFRLHGAVDSSKEVFQSSRVCLAPLRFGAGLKGKFIDSMTNGTPNVTSSIGVEGMLLESEWSGYFSDNPKEIAEMAVKLYSDKESWIRARDKGFQIINNKFSDANSEIVFMDLVQETISNLKLHRHKNFLGKILHFHIHRSTEFMSRWIEEKNKKR